MTPFTRNRNSIIEEQVSTKLGQLERKRKMEKGGKRAVTVPEVKLVRELCQ